MDVLWRWRRQENSDGIYLPLTQVTGQVETEPRKKRAYNRKATVQPTECAPGSVQGLLAPELTSLPPRQARRRKEKKTPEVQRDSVEGAQPEQPQTGSQRVRKPRTKKAVEVPPVQGPLEESGTPLLIPKRVRMPRPRKTTTLEVATALTMLHDIPDTLAPNSLGPPLPETTPKKLGTSYLLDCLQPLTLFHLLIVPGPELKLG